MSTRIYAIIDNETGNFSAFNRKCAWLSQGAAKNAWALHVGFKFDSQRPMRFKIVELTEYYHMYKGLCE